jgi:hypothetical protein
MRITNLMSVSKQGKVLLAVLLAVSIVPFLSVSSSEKKLYVNSDASGKMDGSADHPFQKINDALGEASDGTTIYLANGTYEENIEIKDEVTIVGEDREDTIIEADDDDETVVTMHNKTKINNLTVKGGDDGVRVKKDDRAEIVDCIIEDNDDDGIEIESGKAWDTRRVVIIDSLIKDNGRAGIFGRERRYVIMNNEIRNNDEDGIKLLGGADAWIYGNDIKYNDQHGMSLEVSHSDIDTKNNRIADNEKHGVELYSNGALGQVNIEKTKIIDNGGYAIAKLQAPNVAYNWYNALTFLGLPNEFWGNDLGNISPIRIAQ